MSVNIFIENKEHFLTPKSIVNFKKAYRAEKEITISKYLKEGYNYITNKKDKQNVIITVISQEEYDRIERKKMLRMKLRNAQFSRSTQPKKNLNSLKRSIPDNIFKAYTNIIKKYQFNIPAPDEVINNLEKYRLQVSLLMNTTQKVSNDETANNLVKKYFKLLGEFLGIEPMEIPTQLPENNNNSSMLKKLDKGDDTETESEDEAPDLVGA